MNDKPKTKRIYHKNIPCKNCITFPVCMSTFNDFDIIRKRYCIKDMEYYQKMIDSQAVKYNEYLFIKDLTRKCSLILEYVFKYSYDGDVTLYRIENVKKFFYDKLYPRKKDIK